MNSDMPFVSEIVLIGGGHAHALFLRQWGMNPVPGARLTLINPNATAPYTGMLPGYVAGHYGRDDLEIDLVRLARFAGARMIFGHVTAIDRAAKRLSVTNRPDVAYDIASLDIGITSDMPDIPGFREHAIAAKPLGPFAARWQAFVEARKNGPVCVIGGGIAGVELALAMHHRLAAQGTPTPVSIIESGDLLTGTAPATAQKLRAELTAASIEIFENARATSLQADTITLSDGRTIAAQFTVGAAGARPFGWLENTGLTLTNGYVSVDATLRSLNDPAIYAVGDCAHLSHAPRPKAGVFAVRAAPVLAANIRADLIETARRSFTPQKHYLKLVSLGRKEAVADKYGLAIDGAWAWTWKDRIDRRFMDRLNHPPKMQPPVAPKNAAKGVSKTLGSKPMCGGCGSKVGANVLDTALSALDMPTSPDIITATGDDAAVLSFGSVQQVISTDHLRAFWDDPYLMTRIAAIHALGDVWAMGAAPQTLLAQFTLPRMSEPLQADWLRECLAAASDVARETGAALVGGHTTQGAELTLGFTATGTLKTAAKTLARAQPGDILIVTRPIGSGTLMAAEMAGEAQGDDIASVLQAMATAPVKTAEILAQVAHSLTDITGFGLAGHAARMAFAAGLSAHIDSAAVPLYSGAETLAANGIASTIAPANRAALGVAMPDTARAALLVDPQTAGGFLAAIPPDALRTTIASLIDAGATATQIGHLTPWSDHPIVVT